MTHQPEENLLDAVFNFLKSKRFPSDSTKNQKDAIRSRSKKFKLGEDDTLYYLAKGKELIVVRDPNHYIRVFEECHSSTTGAHLGRDRTISRAGDRYYWPTKYTYLAEKILHISHVIVDGHTIMVDEASQRFADVGNKRDGCRKLRVVHISDTQMEHDNIVNEIPPGDVIVHSGDFSKRRFMNFFYNDHSDSEMLRKVNSFFNQLPHRYKIFVAGNHDTFLTQYSAEEIQKRLPDVTYLQDSSVVCDGIKFYGSPWTIKSKKIKTSKAFTVADTVLRERWGAVHKDTDVLITHTPPYGALDYSRHLGDTPPESVCQFCDKLHPRVGHAGSLSLREAVLQTIRPKIHLFGHLHGSAGLYEYDGITFSNAAFASKRKFNVIDIYPS